MKTTAYNDEHNLDLGTGGPLVGDQGGIAGGDVAGAWGDLSVVGLRRDVSIASNLLPVSVGDVLTIIQASPAVARFATPSNTGVSFGSNATTIAAANDGGAATTASRSDHRHAGIASITASSSNSMERATVNLRPGTNVTFGLSDSDASGALDTITINSAAAGGGSGITIEEVDGSPTGSVTKLVLPNGTLSIVGSTATYTPASSGGGATWTAFVNEDGTSFANFTAASGTWGTSGGKITQTDTGGTWRRAKFNTMFPFGWPWIMQADVAILTAGGRVGLGISDGSSSGGLSVHLLQGTGVNIDRDEVANIRQITATINTSTTYALRVVMGSAWISIYLDGTLIGNVPLMNTSGWRVNADFFTLFSYGASVTFDNVKAWVLSGSAP